MKKFIFRLETLLKMRSVHETTLKRDLEHAYHRWNHIKEKEKMLQTQITALSEEIKKKKEAGQLALHETYHQILSHLQTSLAQTQQNLWGQQSQLDEHKKRLDHAMKERKIIEKIKEKHYASWRSPETYMDEALIDEISCHKPTHSQ